MQYVPVPAAALEIEIDPRPGHYYVSVQDNGRGLLALGPFDAHSEALGQVDAVRNYAQGIDPRAVWYAYGTARREICDSPVQGTLNAALGIRHE